MSRNTGFSELTRRLVLERAVDRMGYTVAGQAMCEVCGGVGIEQWHHRRPRGAGGSRRPSTNSPANCLGVCRACHDVIEGRSVVHPFNGRVRGSRAESLANGWLLTQTQEPTVQKVLTAEGWELFDDLGHREAL